MTHHPWLLAAALLAACTFDAGHGFATMEPGTLQVRLIPGPARDLGDDTLLTDPGYEVAIERFELRVDRIELSQLSTTAGSRTAAFDPANPPPGYSLCHGGHCHAADGSLPTYEEIQAELAGGGATLRPVVTLPVGRTLCLLPGEVIELGNFEPSRELPEGSIDRAEVLLTHLEIDAQIEAGGLDEDASLQLRVDLPLDEALRHTLGVTIDRDGPARLRPRVTLELDGAFFDGIDFADLGDAGVLVVERSDDIAAATLSEALVAGSLQVAL